MIHDFFAFKFHHVISTVLILHPDLRIIVTIGHDDSKGASKLRQTMILYKNTKDVEQTIVLFYYDCNENHMIAHEA